MEDTIDKRRARYPDDLIVVVKEFCTMSTEPAQAKESVKLLKAMLSRVTGGKEDFLINADEEACEATALSLGRDTLWKNTQVELMRALQKAITISRLKGKVFELQWLVFVNRCIQADILSASHFLLQLHLNDEVLEQDYFNQQQHHRPMDPWDSVHFYSLDVIANLVISSFWENPGSKRFLRNMITSGFFEKLLKIVNAADSSERFLTTCIAVYIAANVCSQFAAGNKVGPVNKGVVRSGDILNKIAHFIYKENVIKMATEWFKNGVEQFEFDALAERPDGLAVMNTDGVFMTGCEEMSRKKTLQCAINWAVSLQFHSIEYLAAICNPEVGYQDTVLRERHIRRLIEMLVQCILLIASCAQSLDLKDNLTHDVLSVAIKSLFRWLKSPILHSDVCVLIQSCLRVVSQIADSESASWTLMNEKSFMQQLEYGVFYPNPRAVSLYFEVITKLARFRGKPRELLLQSEVICRAAVLNLYSPEETVHVFALAFLHILVETSVPRFLRHFPLHEISIFRKFIFDKTDSGLSVSDLLAGCMKFGKEEYEKAQAATPETIDFSIDHASHLKDEGNNYFKNNQFPAAIEAYSEAIKVCPPTIKEGKTGKKETMKWNSLCVTLYCNRAQSYLKNGNYQKAVDDCDIAVARCIGAAERLQDFDDELFKKAVYRRSLALFNLEEYERAAIDIGECVILEQDRKEFRAHMDKVVMMCRHKLGNEIIRKCIECDGGRGFPLKRCPNCPALYCSRICQLEAWKNHHKASCIWYRANHFPLPEDLK